MDMHDTIDDKGPVLDVQANSELELFQVILAAILARDVEAGLVTADWVESIVKEADAAFELAERTGQVEIVVKRGKNNYDA